MSQSEGNSPSARGFFGEGDRSQHSRPIFKKSSIEGTFGAQNEGGGFRPRNEGGGFRPRSEGGGFRNANWRNSSFSKKKYDENATVKVDNIGTEQIGAVAVILAAEEICGKNTVLAVVPDKERKDSYEITMDTVENACLLTNGLTIGGLEFDCSLVHSDSITVSFLYVPAYIKDKVILDKLREKNITIVSQVYRHTYPGTQVADGTRLVKVQFPPGMVSLAWSMAFDVQGRRRYFKVVHNRQRKVCSECFSPDHVFKECPNIKCRKCGQLGHMQRECRNKRCVMCGNFPHECMCPDEEGNLGGSARGTADRTQGDEQDLSRNEDDQRMDNDNDTDLVDEQKDNEHADIETEAGKEQSVETGDNLSMENVNDKESSDEQKDIENVEIHTDVDTEQSTKADDNLLYETDGDLSLNGDDREWELAPEYTEERGCKFCGRLICICTHDKCGQFYYECKCFKEHSSESKDANDGEQELSPNNDVQVKEKCVENINNSDDGGMEIESESRESVGNTSDHVEKDMTRGGEVEGKGVNCSSKDTGDSERVDDEIQFKISSRRRIKNKHSKKKNEKSRSRSPFNRL